MFENAPILFEKISLNGIMSNLIKKKVIQKEKKTISNANESAWLWCCRNCRGTRFYKVLTLLPNVSSRIVNGTFKQLLKLYKRCLLICLFVCSAKMWGSWSKLQKFVFFWLQNVAQESLGPCSSKRKLLSVSLMR